MGNNRKKLGDDRVYTFETGAVHTCDNGQYINAMRLKALEGVYGPLVKVTYHGKTVMVNYD